MLNICKISRAGVYQTAALISKLFFEEVFLITCSGLGAAVILFKWFTDSDKRKIAEIHSKRRAIEEVVRNRLNEASSSFNRQMEEVLHDYRQTAIVLLNPIVQDTEAVQQLHQMHRRVALRIIEQSEATMKQLSREVDKL